MELNTKDLLTQWKDVRYCFYPQYGYLISKELYEAIKMLLETNQQEPFIRNDQNKNESS